jgi:hypothetical protein
MNQDYNAFEYQEKQYSNNNSFTENQMNDNNSMSSISQPGIYGPRVPINPREQQDYFNKMDNSVKGGTPLSNVNIIPFDDFGYLVLIQKKSLDIVLRILMI